MKTTLRVIGRVLGKLTYITTALILSIVATLALFAYAGYYYYEGYYKEYMKVQQTWSQVDNSYISYLNLVEDNIDTFSSELGKKQFKSDDDKVTAQAKLNFLKETITEVRYSMTYQEKFSTYPLITNSVNDVEGIINNEGKEDIAKVFNSLGSIENEILVQKKEYNSQAREFNERNKKFPESLIADVGSFHVWNEMP